MEKAIEAAKAVNTLISLNERVNEALMDIIHEYFQLPDCDNEDLDEIISDSDSELEREFDDHAKESEIEG